MMSNHFFHLVTCSPWPILMSMSILNSAFGILHWITMNSILPSFLFMFLLILVFYQWWRDVIRESLYEGSRSKSINSLINLGFILFILSEICFFMSFFWAYFFYSLSPSQSLGMVWPPVGIQSIGYLGIPFLNTLILLSSGFFITWAHYAAIQHNFHLSKISLIMCLWLGFYFLIVQMYEYKNMNFSMSESVFGNSFYILTGFHGFHVIVGFIFIAIMMFRLFINSFSSISMFGLEYSIWYWHFVDLVWLFLYCLVYWWGS